MKKVLILTVTAGNGHNACSAAMKRKIEELGDAEVKIVDLLKAFSTELNVWVADGGYNLAVGKLPKLYDAFFNKYLNAPPCKRYSTPSQGVALSCVEGLLKEILEFQPDVIYATHFYGAIAITDLKLAYDLPFVSVSAALDYVLTPFWESGVGVDYFVIPNEDFIDYSVYKGYKSEQLLPIGLPVNGRTLEVMDKAQARKILNLDQNTFTVMIMFGGGHWNGGYKIFRQTVKALTGRKAQIIMINGKNETSFKKVAETKLPKDITVLNVGFTNEIPTYMSAADVILNKFGGTSVTEMINKGLPMLITEKIAAQEKYNLVYFKQKKAALSFKDEKTLKENLLKLMDDPALREEMARNTAPFKKDAISEFAEFILSQPKADYSQILSENIDFKQVKNRVKHAVKAADKTERKKQN